MRYTFPRTLALCLGSGYSERTINNAYAFLICTSEVRFWFPKWHQRVEPTSCERPKITKYIIRVLKYLHFSYCVLHDFSLFLLLYTILFYYQSLTSGLTIKSQYSNWSTLWIALYTLRLLTKYNHDINDKL